MTDDFARLMMADGVRQKSEPRRDPPRRTTRTPQIAPAAPTPVVTPTAPTQPVYAWRGGADARRTLDTSFERLVEDRRRGARTWATGVRQDGSGMAMTTSSVPAILSEADRTDMRLVILGGDGWTCVLHPKLGTATLDLDPVGVAR